MVRRDDAQWFTGTSSRNVPASLMRLGGPSTPLVPRTLTSKNLTVQSLLLTATRGSALLSFERVRLREVKRTELLIEPDRTPSYCHSLLEAWDGESDESRGDECLEWIDRCSSASCPPAARSRSSESGILREAMVFGT
jgi:hypothetical protein